jgi:hypothetical protein
MDWVGAELGWAFALQLLGWAWVALGQIWAQSVMTWAGHEQCCAGLGLRWPWPGEAFACVGLCLVLPVLELVWANMG